MKKKLIVILIFIFTMIVIQNATALEPKIRERPIVFICISELFKMITPIKAIKKTYYYCTVALFYVHLRHFDEFL